jgi:hypothetical protein
VNSEDESGSLTSTGPCQARMPALCQMAQAADIRWVKSADGSGGSAVIEWRNVELPQGDLKVKTFLERADITCVKSAGALGAAR